MHIPDGFLDTRTIATTTALSVTGLAVALRTAGAPPERRQIPLMGVAAAFIFAAQMINFPVAAGTSGHLMGATLAAVLLGPARAVLVMSAVVITQALLFADGGILALGANLFNMAVTAPVVGYGAYRLVRRIAPGERGQLTAAGFAAWFSTVVAATITAGELAWSGTAPWQAALPAMAGIHMIIGVGEGAITALVLAAVSAARPELLDPQTTLDRTAGAGYALLVAVGLALFVAPFASPWPDGLEQVAQTLGFEHQAFAEPLLASPLGDYTVPGIGSPVLATALAGLVGTLIVFGLASLLARMLAPASQPDR